MIIQLLSQNITIEFVEELSGAYGDYNGHELKIRLIRGLQKDVFLTTLAHELTHVKQHIFGLEMDEGEANRDAMFWHAFLKTSKPFQKIWKAYNE